MKKIFFFFLVIFSYLSASDWHNFHSVIGKCDITFPIAPQHSSKDIPLNEEVLKYDLYFADSNDVIFMMLIANYPAKIDPTKESISLEGFISGIMNHSKDNKLIYADFQEFQNRNALEFLISKENRYFKAKALINENKLYLLSIESDNMDLLDQSFDKFIGSFQLTN